MLACNSFTPFEVFFPFSNGELLKEIHCRIEFSERRVKVDVVSFLFPLDSEAILTQERLDGNRVRNPEQRPHEQLRNTHRRERNLERIEIEQEENTRRLFVDRQEEAPMLDPVARIGPLVWIVEPELIAETPSPLSFPE